MNRIIKFRAWNKKYNEMVTVDGLTPTDGGYNVLFGIGECIKNGDYNLMQYTGLHDKNGKEIYEGDVVKSSFVCQVIYDGKWMLHDLGDGGFYFELSSWEKGIKPETVEIIGNIYSNPELIK